MKVSYIVPVYIINQQGFDLTKSAIASLRASDNSAEMVIVDNASELGGGFLRSVADIYIRNRKNLGFCPAINQGFKLATADILAPANNDIRVSSNWKAVAEEILEDKKVGSVHFRMTKYNVPFKYGNKTWKTGRERWCTTSFFVIKREALPKDLWDENYGLGGYDDYDFWHRVRHLNGWQTAYTTKASYQHFDSFTYLAMSQEERAKRDKKNFDYFTKKWGKNPDQLFSEKYPEQWAKDWRGGFDEL